MRQAIRGSEDQEVGIRVSGYQEGRRRTTDDGRQKTDDGRRTTDDSRGKTIDQGLGFTRSFLGIYGEKTVKNGSLLNSFEQKRQSFGHFLTSFGHFLKGKGQVVKKITPDGELKTGVVKRNWVFVEKTTVVFGVPGGKKVGGLGKKRVFVEKTGLVFGVKIGVGVGGNWVRLG